MSGSKAVCALNSTYGRNFPTEWAGRKGSEEGQARIEKKSAIFVFKTWRVAQPRLTAPARHFHGAARNAAPQ